MGALLAELIIGLIFEVVFEFLFAIGVVTVTSPFRKKRQTSAVLAYLGIGLISAIAALIYHLLVPKPLFPSSPVPGISIFVSTVAVGFLMHFVGKWLEAKGKPPSHLTTFVGGGLFALVFSTARFFLVM